MDKNKLLLATTVEHQFYDDTTVKCTLAMFQLKRLASKDKGLYKVVTKVLANGTEDIFEQIRVIYAAYVCANMDSADLMTEDEFTMMCGSDYAGVAQTMGALINPKKRKASEDHSN